MYYKKTWKNKKRIPKCKKCYKDFDTSNIMIPETNFWCDSCHKVYWENITNIIKAAKLQVKV